MRPLWLENRQHGGNRHFRKPQSVERVLPSFEPRQGLEVLAINSDDEREAIARYVEASGWTFPVALGSRERDGLNLPTLFYVELFPTNYVIDASGRVVYRQAGWDDAALRRVLDGLGIKSR